METPKERPPLRSSTHFPLINAPDHRELQVLVRAVAHHRRRNRAAARERGGVAVRGGERRGGRGRQGGQYGDRKGHCECVGPVDLRLAEEEGSSREHEV